jgi:hypothetical protein
MTIDSFIGRFNYLKLNGSIGGETFGSDRYFNQLFYHDSKWRSVRNHVILRDLGHDLAMADDAFEIPYTVMVHHINPITIEDIERGSSLLFDEDNLVCCSHRTHNAIHYGDESILPIYEVVERFPHDTSPWRIKHPNERNNFR